MGKRPVCLIILDGWGYREDSAHNAIAAASTPFFNSLWGKYPHTLLDASAEAVGLPEGQIGNSEIGHMTMGTGRIIDTDLVKINKAASVGEFHSNPAFIRLFDHAKKYGTTLHCLGLLSPGGIHSHSSHLFAFLEAARAAGVQKVAIHAFTDGRDVPPRSAAQFLSELEHFLVDKNAGVIASVSGRFFAMDRDKNWDRLKKAEEAIFESKGNAYKGQKPSEVVEEFYRKGMTDEFLEPMVFLDDLGKGVSVEANDGVFFFNYRPDRVRQLASKISEQVNKKNLIFVTMTKYGKRFGAEVAFPDAPIEDSLAAVLSRAGLTQSHIAETEKYAHVTYFFNGGREEPHEGEQHLMIDSRRDVPTHDMAPEMRAKEIAEKAIERVGAGDDFLLLNFANADMVGHTANVPAIIVAVETVDRELKRVVEKVLAAGGIALITADPGNAEQNVDQETGEMHTAHTLNVVPLIIVSDSPTLHNSRLASGGTLADITPTILALIGLEKPVAMTGRSLL